MNSKLENPIPLNKEAIQGILLVDKPSGKTSFTLISYLRRITGVKKIGHAGTLDPFATGVMILLIGKQYTRQSNQFMSQDKEYRATLHLGIATDSFDCDGKITSQSAIIPTQEEIEIALTHFQGTIKQVPPMFSAKKIKGKKLYELARQGITIEREAQTVTLSTQFIAYHYPFLELHIQCSKGTYIRTIAHEIGALLSCGAHLHTLTRTRSGSFHLNDCLPIAQLNNLDIILSHLKT